ncbi:hypothetical protein [Staphylococcus delphini]|uniref:hypothetical protein n=1 Tax=Staphylococcus delphini TaxID=53344 RepID=UPI0012D36A6A|nr:hypothetical protein [Staphylococcus delphini]MTV19415.1 hypothetical protein [Staphylococcus delphini]
MNSLASFAMLFDSLVLTDSAVDIDSDATVDSDFDTESNVDVSLIAEVDNDSLILMLFDTD